MADVRAYRHDRRFAVPFCSQVTDKLRLNHLRILASAAAFAAILCNPCAAADAPKDITIRTGPQLKERLDQELKTKDGYSAIQYFEKKFGDKVSPEGLSEVQFRSADKDYSIFFIPFTTPAATSKDGQQEHPVVLSAKGPKGTIVHLGTVIAHPKEPPEIKDEKVVVNGQVEPGKGELKNFLKCAVKDCLTASVTCLAVGEGWPLCLCLGCGTGVATCGLTELFFP